MACKDAKKKQAEAENLVAENTLRMPLSEITSTGEIEQSFRSN